MPDFPVDGRSTASRPFPKRKVRNSAGLGQEGKGPAQSKSDRNEEGRVVVALPANTMPESIYGKGGDTLSEFVSSFERFAQRLGEMDVPHSLK